MCQAYEAEARFLRWLDKEDTTMSERDSLIVELKKYKRGTGSFTCVHLSDIADFILEDRKRIVAPIKAIQGLTDNKAILKLCDETLRNAGLE